MGRALLSCIAGLGLLAAGCEAPSGNEPDAPVLRVAVPREPSTWNRLLASDLVTHVVASQLHAPLIRLNPETQTMEPALASSWAFSDDERELSFTLRPDVRFSDGEPFTAADVVFTFRALHDSAVASPLADTAQIDGEPLIPEAVDELTVRFRLPRRTATVERIFDSIGILPRHRLLDALERGAFGEASGLGASPDEVVGLGPFRLREHRPGERVVVERNPHYYRAAAGLPRLEEIVFEVVPERAARALRLLAGEVDLLDNVDPETFLELRRAADDGVTAVDVGPSMVSERLWFNLGPESPIDPVKRGWFRDARFRRAVSLAIDRDGLARVVYEGLATPATGVVPPSNRFWRNEELEPLAHDAERARELLSSAGFRSVEGGLVDPSGVPVRFTLITVAGNEARSRAAAFIQEDLAAIGVEMNIAEIEGGALLAAVTQSLDYDACLLGLTQTDPDPSAEMALWKSEGPLHFWNPAQPSPATEWESRIDALMERQMGSADAAERKRAYDEVQRVLARELPIIDLVVPHALVAHRNRVEGLRPSPFAPSLWNVDELSVRE